MNFISKREEKEIAIELKYCERCGGLWLRPRGVAGVHCGACRLHLEAVPGVENISFCKTRGRKPRLLGSPGQARQRQKRNGGAHIEHLQGVATAAEVWA